MHQKHQIQDCPSVFLQQNILCMSASGPHRLVVRTSRCGRDNPGSTPGEDIFSLSSCLLFLDGQNMTEFMLFFSMSRTFQDITAPEDLKVSLSTAKHPPWGSNPRPQG